MQELAKGLRETLAQFRASFFPSDGLKLGVRHILRPLTPWSTSPRNYLCASTPWPPPPKDNVTICLFNCLSVTLSQAFSVGVYGFFFHLYLFIYLARRGGGCLAPETGSLCLGLVSHGYNPPSSSAPPAFYPAPHSQTPWICLGADLRVIVHCISITIHQSMRLFSFQWTTEVLFNCSLEGAYCLLLQHAQHCLQVYLQPHSKLPTLSKVTNKCKMPALQKPQATEGLCHGHSVMWGLESGMTYFSVL